MQGGDGHRVHPMGFRDVEREGRWVGAGARTRARERDGTDPREDVGRGIRHGDRVHQHIPQSIDHILGQLGNEDPDGIHFVDLHRGLTNRQIHRDAIPNHPLLEGPLHQAEPQEPVAPDVGIDGQVHLQAGILQPHPQVLFLGTPAQQFLQAGDLVFGSRTDEHPKARGRVTDVHFEGGLAFGIQRALPQKTPARGKGVGCGGRPGFRALGLEKRRAERHAHAPRWVGLGHGGSLGAGWGRNCGGNAPFHRQSTGQLIRTIQSVV